MVHRLYNLSSQSLVSEVFMRQNSMTDLRRRLKDKGDVPAETRGDWSEIFESSNIRTKLLSLTCRRLSSTILIKLEAREFDVDSGASMPRESPLRDLPEWF